MNRMCYMAVITILVCAFGISISYAYDEVDVSNGGTIMGHVKFVGAPPKLAPVKVNKNQDFCGNEKQSEALVLGKDGAVRLAVGYLDKIEKGKKIDRQKQTNLDQKKCLFSPHVITVTKGTDVAVLNSDPILHNININVDGVQRLNKGQPIQNQVIVSKLRHTGQGDITCDSHTHMRGYVMIFDHPYHAASDETGTFTLDNVPPGKYTLKVWHESWKIIKHDDDGRPIYDKPILLTKEVEVNAKGTSHVNFEIK